MADEATYLVIDSSGKTYGPVDFATLKQWATDGRVLPDTNLKNESTGVTMQARFVAGLFERSKGDAPPVQRPAMSTPPPVDHGAARPKSSVGLIVGLVILGAVGFCGVVGAAILLPVFASAGQAAKKTQTLSNLKQIAVGTMMYSTDWDDKYPPYMASIRAAGPYLMPYIKNPEVMRTANPAGSEFLGNPKLSAKLSTKVKKPDSIILFYDSKPWPDNKGLLSFADGHAKSTQFNFIQTNLPLDPFK